MYIVTVSDLNLLMLSNVFDSFVNCELLADVFAQRRRGDCYCFAGVARFLIHLHISCILPLAGHAKVLRHRDVEQGKR